jgi:hypothetical protein
MPPPFRARPRRPCSTRGGAGGLRASCLPQASGSAPCSPVLGRDGRLQLGRARARPARELARGRLTRRGGGGHFAALDQRSHGGSGHGHPLDGVPRGDTPPGARSTRFAIGSARGSAFAWCGSRQRSCTATRRPRWRSFARRLRPGPPTARRVRPARRSAPGNSPGQTRKAPKGGLSNTAPAPGLEPGTRRLTAACSTD